MLTYKENKTIKDSLNRQQQNIVKLLLIMGLCITIIGLALDYYLVLAVGILYIVSSLIARASK